MSEFQPTLLSKLKNKLSDDALSRLAFDNSRMSNIISLTKTGEIIMANTAACQLLHYSLNEIKKNTSEIFLLKEKSQGIIIKEGR